MTPEIPDAAVRAALAERASLLVDSPSPMVLPDTVLVRKMLQAALPHLLPQAPDLTAERWRQGGSHTNNVWADVGSTGGKPGLPAGRMDSAEIAARACSDHNAMLDLSWLLAAGLRVIVEAGERGYDVTLERPAGPPATSRAASPAAALAKAKEWSEREGITP